MDKDKNHLIQELTGHPGWKVLEEWLNETDNRISKANRRFITIPKAEGEKWLYFYSGQANLIDSLRNFIKRATEAPFKKKVKKKGSLE